MGYPLTVVCVRAGFFMVHSYSHATVLLDPKPKRVGFQVPSLGGPWTLTFAPTLQSTKSSLSATCSRLANASRAKLTPRARLMLLDSQPLSELDPSNFLLPC